MKKIKQLVLGLLSVSLVFTLLAFTSPVKANSEPVTKEIALTDGFICLFPHKSTPTPAHPITMKAVPSTEYNGYSQEILNKVAAAVILRSEFHDQTQTYVDPGDLQSVIWAIVCPAETCEYQSTVAGYKGHLSGRATAQQYYQYVMENYETVKDEYVMTIWVSPDDTYQDVLEVKMVEKHGVPSVEKKVLDCNDSDNLEDELKGWQDSADYDIGDEVPFQITATLEDLPKFNAYYLEFVDQMDHFDLNRNTIKVELINNGISKDVTDKFEITTNTNGTITNLNIKCDNVLPLGAIDKSQFIVTYTATLNRSANIGTDGNPNKVHLVYTRTSGTADKGITPDDLVKVFTYRLVINKVDENHESLNGASFKLSKKVNGDYQEIIGTKDPTGTIFTWEGLDDGTYKLEEIETPPGYNTMEPLEFWIKAVHESYADNPQLTYYYSNYDGFDYFVTYEDYNKELYSKEFPIPQLPGYILPWASDEITGSVVNVSGTVLPETGGIGSKIIYSIGTIMLLTSSILLVSKKRMK